MNKLRFLAWSIVLSIPVQYLFLLALQLYEFFTVGVAHADGATGFGCTNYHEAGLSPCSAGAMLMNPVLGMVVFNALSYGLFTLLFAGISAVLLYVGRKLHDGRARDA